MARANYFLVNPDHLLMLSPTSINFQPTAPAPPTPQDRLKQNHTRSKKTSMARAKNLRYYPQINEHICTMPEHGSDDITVAQVELRQRFEQYRKNLLGCACNSLYRKAIKGRECSYISSQTCSHRLCNVCNMLRSRKLRRKWRAFLQDTERNVPLRKAQAHFWNLTPMMAGKELEYYEDENESIFDVLPHTSGAEILQKFDLMHLTLTVPHEGGRWLGQDYYAKELLQKFNEMRKAKWWVQHIFGGEYTVETTQNADGLHIHIHALLFVDKDFIQSRNKLSEMILRRWNHLTIDEASTRAKLLDAGRRDGIQKGFAHLIKNKGTAGEDRDALNNLLLELDGRGSTMVGLKSLYYEISAEDAVRRTNSFTENGRHFAYCKRGDVKSTLRGVIECLKYHFEPCAMEDEDGNLNLPLLDKVLPNIYRQRLYGKLGGFYGVRQLNVMEDPLSAEDMLEDAAETATEAYDPATGQPIDPSEYQYVIADAYSIRYDTDRPLCYLQAGKIKSILGGDAQISLGAAVRALAFYSFKKKE